MKTRQGRRAIPTDGYPVPGKDEDFLSFRDRYVANAKSWELQARMPGELEEDHQALTIQVQTVLQHLLAGTRFREVRSPLLRSLLEALSQRAVVIFRLKIG